MAKLGKEFENRLSVSRKVIAAATTHGPSLAPKLAEKALEAQGADKAPTAASFAAVFVSLGDTLRFATKAIETTSLAYSAEQADDVAPRAAREKTRDGLLAPVVQLRSTIEGALGTEGLHTYGLEGETPRAPKALSTHVANVITLMTAKPATLTTELGGTLSTAAIVAVLESKKALLDDTLKDVDREERELEDTYGKREQAMERWTEVYQGVANALTGLFRLAGRKDLAERVRPTSRTVSGEDPGPAEEDAAPRNDNGSGTP